MKNTTSGRVYFRSGSDRSPNVFFGRFGRRGLALIDAYNVKGPYRKSWSWLPLMGKIAV